MTTCDHCGRTVHDTTNCPAMAAAADRITARIMARMADDAHTHANAEDAARRYTEAHRK